MQDRPQSDRAAAAELPLPVTGFLRLARILGDRDTPALIPTSRSAWYRGMEQGKYPKPIYLSERTPVWRVEDIRQILETGKWTPSADATSGVAA